MNTSAELRTSGAKVIVTGASGGIGAAIAERLIADGWEVIAADLKPPHDDIEGHLTFRELDVSSSDMVSGFAEDLAGDGTQIAGLVNVAGLLQDLVPLLAMDESEMRRIWDVNYFGALNCIRAFVPLMPAGASIVNITSVNEQRPLPLHAYGPAKVALGAVTSVAAGELGRRGIRVNAVAPGFTLTPLLAEKIELGLRDASSLEANTALDRLVDPDEVAAVVSFLLSDDASAVTGTSIPVDCGWLARSHWMDYGDRLV